MPEREMTEQPKEVSREKIQEAAKALGGILSVPEILNATDAMRNFRYTPQYQTLSQERKQDLDKAIKALREIAHEMGELERKDKSDKK